MDAASVIVCPQCRIQLAPSLLSCPSCQRLVHATQLNDLAAKAQEAQKAGDLFSEVGLWRQALELLPTPSRQHQVLADRITWLTQQIDSGAPQPQRAASSQLGKGLAAAGFVGLMIWKFKFVLVFLATKGKLLLMGLTNATTMLSMLLAMGVYWSIWGWAFALGLVLSIYVHEMGHVAALRKFGFRTTAPMFIPGVGAVIRAQQRMVNTLEDARVGLAGPIWGLGAALVAAGIWLATGQAFWGAIAHVGAWINLFNLIPLFPLDGGRGFRALSRRQAWLIVATFTTMWIITHEGMLALLLIVGCISALSKKATSTGDRTAFIHFLLLIVVLSLMCRLPINLSAYSTTRPQLHEDAVDSSPTQPSPHPHPDRQQN